MQIASASESPTMSFPCGVFRFCVRPRSGGRKKQHDESALSKLFRPEWEEQAGKLYEIFLRVSFRAQNIPAKRQRPRRGRVERGRRGTEYVGGRCLWCVAGLGQQPDRQSSTRVLLLAVVTDTVWQLLSDSDADGIPAKFYQTSDDNDQISWSNGRAEVSELCDCLFLHFSHSRYTQWQ